MTGVYNEKVDCIINKGMIMLLFSSGVSFYTMIYAVGDFRGEMHSDFALHFNTGYLCPLLPDEG